jgi:nicotinamide mononucleotide transporter PnuC
MYFPSLYTLAVIFAREIAIFIAPLENLTPRACACYNKFGFGPIIVLLEVRVIRNPFRLLTPFEWALWLCSMLLVSLSYLIVPEHDWWSLVASLIGVTSLVFIAKGHLFGSLLSIVFSTLYAIISVRFQYYGEVITYAFMVLPISVISLIAWIRHPYKDTEEVEVGEIAKKHLLLMPILTVAVTGILFFVLRWLGNANLLVSTISIATSFIASYLSILRSPYYALGYAANDIVLIVLWVLAGIKEPSYIPMVLCFIAFLANDLYAFINWRRMRKRQHQSQQQPINIQ